MGEQLNEERQGDEKATGGVLRHKEVILSKTTKVDLKKMMNLNGDLGNEVVSLGVIGFTDLFELKKGARGVSSAINEEFLAVHVSPRPATFHEFLQALVNDGRHDLAEQCASDMFKEGQFRDTGCPECDKYIPKDPTDLK